MNADERAFLEEKFTNLHHRLDRVEAREERTQEMTAETASALRALTARMDEKVTAADATHARLDEELCERALKTDCETRTAAVASRVQDLEDDRKKVLGGIAVAFITGLLSLFKFGFAKNT
ncbi:MAG: hypothetical protein HUU06_01395 [Planctomycetaceae bacterium]|nr:hypothetical protein [Planctomycetaceae bacterium]